MNQGGDVPAQHDYGCEMIAAIALLGLSALSHFWYIAIVMGFVVLVWGAIQLAARMVQAATYARIHDRGTHVENEPTAAFEPAANSGSGISTAQNTPERGLLEI